MLLGQMWVSILDRMGSVEEISERERILGRLDRQQERRLSGQ
jgi:hypothetical protein